MLERLDVDRRNSVLKNVRRTLSGAGRRPFVELAKTSRKPSTGSAHPARARGARLETPAPARYDVAVPGSSVGGVAEHRQFSPPGWAPAIEASGVTTPARIYDLRSTFATRALAAGVPVFELAKIMGTSIRMIERHYGTLLDGAGASIATRLDAYDAQPEHGTPDREHGER